MSRESPISSGLIGEASFRDSKITAGRRFANSPNAERMPKRPASGRLLPCIPSHFGPPTAPSRTASDALHLSMVSCGNGSPTASIAQPPINASVYSTPKLNFSETLSKTFTASFTISGPIPSPLSTVIRYVFIILQLLIVIFYFYSLSIFPCSARLMAQIIPLMEAKLILLSRPTPKSVFFSGVSN